MTTLHDLPVAHLVDLAYQVDASVTWRQDDDDRPSTHRGDMIGLAGLCAEWYERALSQIDDLGEIQIPGVLWIYRNGQEQLVHTQHASEQDFEDALVSRVADAMALMAEAWWSIQQAACIHATRDDGGSAA